MKKTQVKDGSFVDSFAKGDCLLRWGDTVVSKWGIPAGCWCRFGRLNHIHMHSFEKSPSDACRRQIVQKRLISLLSWANCLHRSLQPEGSFDHCGINSARSSKLGCLLQNQGFTELCC